MINYLFTFIFIVSSLVFIKNALHMFQQNRYELYRYTKWLFNVRNIHFSWNFIYALVILLFSIFLKEEVLRILILSCSILYSIYRLLKEEKKEYIKPLVYTARVKRQCVVIGVLMIGLTYLLCLLIKPQYVAIIVLYLPYLLIFVLYVITEPIERLVKRMYENKARNILKNDDSLIKIGITGSFGKTTTKNIVTDIIGESFYSLMTPASYNTPMGITKTIRELLKPIHEVFVCEMGADHVGEISYLMDFVKPKYGIVTTIGPQHLNTFKSMKNIIKEKMQMIEMLPLGGVGIVNIDNEYIRNYSIKNNCRVITVGIDSIDALYKAENIKYTREGSTFSLKFDGKKYKFKTSLLGSHNITNLLCGIALASEMGVKMDDIVLNVEKVRRVEHRLELKNINGYTFIDDAFNSNPVGSKRALDVLELMGGKRVIVTPGLIDLGSEENKYNYEFGKYMLNKADYVLLVGEKNTEYIRKGLRDIGFIEDNIIVVNNVKEAFDYIYANFSIKDTILLENDLPDAFLY